LWGKEDIMAGKKIEKAEERLCFVGDIAKDKSSLENFKRLVRDPKFICKGCGRVAANDSNLCWPEKM
jgi:hypothetical protein